jgi:hypothetical protein
VTVYNKNISSQCYLLTQIEQVQSKKRYICNIQNVLKGFVNVKACGHLKTNSCAHYKI